MSKLIKFYTLNVCNLLYGKYSSIKLGGKCFVNIALFSPLFVNYVMLAIQVHVLDPTFQNSCLKSLLYLRS